MNTKQNIIQLSNQCVMCGLCLPHCPTYGLFRDENESPRGRIALLKAAAENHLDISPSLVQHIDHCLSCRACESMCPSDVQYAQIINLGKELMTTEHKLESKLVAQESALEKMLVNKSWRKWIKASSALTTSAGKIAGKLLGSQIVPKKIQPTLNRLAAIAAEVHRDQSLASVYPVKESSACVALFTGCTGELFDQQTLFDTIALLNACRIEVHIPQQQVCCGALAQRHGNIQEQTRLAAQNIGAFGSAYSAVISSANSCSAQLREYAQNSRLDSAARQAFSIKVHDSVTYIHSLLQSRQPATQHQTASTPEKQTPIVFSALAETILVHIPCSLKNVLHEETQLLELLGQIPGLQLKLIDQQYCCGAAGSYMLKYPDIADQLLELKINDIIGSGCRIMVSSNIGCSLHIKQRLQQLGYTLEIIHPVSLLLRQLKKTGLNN